jgi:hypothetical protein
MINPQRVNIPDLSMIDVPFTASQPCFYKKISGKGQVLWSSRRGLPAKVPLASPHGRMLEFPDVEQAGFSPAFSFCATLKTRYSLKYK